MSDSILSQAEIDALLNGDSTPAETDKKESVTPEVVIEPKVATKDDEAVKPYDPVTQRRIVREKLHALEIINERFARQLRVELFNLLRRAPDITAGPTRVETYQEFARNMPVPTHLNLIHMKPLRGTALFVFSPSLVFMTIEHLFGGECRTLMPIEGREFTDTEQRIISRILHTALETYQQAWEAIYKLEIEYMRSEMQTKFVSITPSPNDIVISTTFSVELGSLTGDFIICIPFAMLEPLRDLLANPPRENQQQDHHVWRKRLEREVTHSSVELVVNLTQIQTQVNRLLTIACGDVFLIDKPDLIEANIAGVPVLKGRYGQNEGHYALQVEQKISPALENVTRTAEFPHSEDETKLE